MAYYWTTEDMDAGRCVLAQLGQMRPLTEVMEAISLDNSPEAMDRVGVSTLMRLAQQTRDLPTSLKAALALLDRTRGKVTPPTLPPAPPALPGEADEWPPYITSRRLAYQDGHTEPAPESVEALEAPEPAVPPAEPVRHPLNIVPPPPEPRFWDRPGVPAGQT